VSKAAGSALPGSADVPAGLDWQTFCATFFPGRHRHDLEALTAYGAYKRSEAVDELSSREVTRIEDAKNGLAGSTALQGWEDEVGAAP